VPRDPDQEGNMDAHFADILEYPNVNQSAFPSTNQSLLMYNTVNLAAP